MMAIKCENCRFWEQINDEGGNCKRYPPTATAFPVQLAARIQVGNRLGPAQFMDVISRPKTKPDDWCGEFDDSEEG